MSQSDVLSWVTLIFFSLSMYLIIRDVYKNQKEKERKEKNIRQFDWQFANSKLYLSEVGSAPIRFRENSHPLNLAIPKWIPDGEIIGNTPRLFVLDINIVAYKLPPDAVGIHCFTDFYDTDKINIYTPSSVNGMVEVGVSGELPSGIAVRLIMWAVKS